MAEHRISKASNIFLEFCRYVIRAYGWLFHRVRVIGGEDFPPTGGVLVVCNHASHLDPAMLSSYAPRGIRFLSKAELFDVPVLKQIITLMGMVPTPRDGNATAAMRAGMRMIKDGYVLGMYPEGTRTRTGERQPAQSGVVALAAFCGDLPIVPAYLDGTFEAMPAGRNFPKFGQRITVVYGSPFKLTAEERNLKNKDELQPTAERIMDRVFALKPVKPST